MLSSRLYYSVKPYLPWRLRMGLRRITARRVLRSCRDTWPIHAAAAQIPAGWQGWPGGARFAFVLTHDVEGPSGYARCRALAGLEQELGFRSCFNFVPEGSYRSEPDFRRTLIGQGFEVGVHDLRHDGKLFHSRRGFERSAERINHYLHDWQATGFRSAFMLRNLDWLHDLDIQYDSSTFDTDPFEPQSDGAGTIYPFWVHGARDGDADAPVAADSSARARGGYLELPYTLPQDSTVFLVLRQTSPELWRQKLDWIARHGGMAMVNVHPDYMSFNGACHANEYPARQYTEFLRYVRAAYGGQYWNATPGEVTDWCCADCRQRAHRSAAGCRVSAPAVSAPSAPGPIPALQGKRAAVLLYSNYPSDPRPRRAAEAMAQAGMAVDLLCLAGETAAEPRQEVVGGVAITRLSLRHQRDSKLGYFRQYGRFFLASFWYLTWTQRHRRYDVIHVHNMPDFLVFAALFPRLRGAKIILDLHDPMPELMMSIYQLRHGDWRVRFLRWLERRSIAFAHLAFTPNQSFRDLFVSRSCGPDKMQIVMNSPEEAIFDPDRFEGQPEPARPTSEFRVIHHGSILHRHGVDLLVEAIARLRPQIPGLRLELYGAPNSFLDVVLGVARRLDVDDIVRYHGATPQDQIAAAIRACDVGVVPNRRTPFTEINLPTRIFEYLAMRRPVIAPATRGIRDYFADDELITFAPDDVSALAAQILWVYRNREAANQYVERGIAVYRRHLWRDEHGHLLRLLSGLVGSPVATPPAAALPSHG